MVVVSYGGGVNTIAMLVLLKRRGIVPYAIVMSDPGHEWPKTYEYRDRVMQPWLLRVGFPKVVVVNREEEAKFRPRSQHVGTLGDECMRLRNLPSIAYGYKKCSIKYKIDPFIWYMERQSWAQAEWNEGRLISRGVGYDRGEERRVKKSLSGGGEDRFYKPFFPLYEEGLYREDCEKLIESEKLPPPPKSACIFCPHNQYEEWLELRDKHPEEFNYAVKLSRSAEVDVPDVVGLMRCNPHGKRQLHVWADGGYDEQDLDKGTGIEEGKPCGCGD